MILKIPFNFLTPHFLESPATQSITHPNNFYQVPITPRPNESEEVKGVPGFSCTLAILVLMFSNNWPPCTQKIGGDVRSCVEPIIRRLIGPRCRFRLTINAGGVPHFRPLYPLIPSSLPAVRLKRSNPYRIPAARIPPPTSRHHIPSFQILHRRRGGYILYIRCAHTRRWKWYSNLLNVCECVWQTCWKTLWGGVFG